MSQPSSLLPDPSAWQAAFSATLEPVFLLNRQRRILLVNRAWEDWVGLTADHARGLPCKRSKTSGSNPWQAIASALAPPSEVLTGKTVRVRRRVGGTEHEPRWCDVDFAPLMGANGLLAILGRIAGLSGPATPIIEPLPEALRTLRRRLAARYQLDTFTSQLPALRRAADQARLAGLTRVPGLIVGEPGTGKEWLARAIHHQGITADQTFALIDCARLPPASVGELLFGAIGLTRRSGMGTLYLKEIAQVPLDVQARLRDWLAEPLPDRPRLLGSASTVPADDVRDGRLMEAFRFALATLEIALPPLRERMIDLPQLVVQLGRSAAEGAAGLSPEAWQNLHAYRWPGNLDELAAVLQSAGRHAKDGRIEATDLPAYLAQAVHLAATPGRAPPRQIPLKALKEQVERRLITLALRLAKGNKSKAARMLAVSRLSLLARIKSLGIESKE